MVRRLVARQHGHHVSASDWGAYVDTHECPQGMEDVVYRTKGRWCTVDGCNKAAETHEVPYGKTSGENLFPICEHHNLSKGGQTSEEWLGRPSLFSIAARGSKSPCTGII